MAQKPTATTATSTNGPETIYLGDEVTLHDTKRGIVRFIGPMEGKNTPIFYGIELKNGAGKNDGTSNGQNFFKCAADKGMFTTKMKISKAKATTESKQFPHVTAGTRVNVTNKSQGVVRYVGHVSFGEDIWIGVELDEANGDHDGTVDKRWYFKCNDKHGIFVRPDAIEIIAEKKKPAASDSTKKSPAAATASGTSATNTKKPTGTKPPAKPAVKTSPNPAAKNGATGAKTTGSTTTKTTTTAAGKTKEAEKNKTTVSKNKSPAQKTTNSATRPVKSPAKKTGTTTTATTAKSGQAKSGTTKEKEKQTDKEKDEKDEKEEIKVGDKILVKPDKKGQVKYVGEASNMGPGIWYGVRLTEKRGQCDGEYRGHEFFQCPEGYGVYIQDTLIVRKLTGEESDGFDFMDEEKSIEAMKEARLEEVRKERAKLQAITQKFKELDTDGNKALSREEFSKLAVEFLQCDPRSARELFMNVDTNGSGEISYAEFEKWLSTGNADIVNALVEEQKNAGAEAPAQEAATGSEVNSDEKKDTETNTTATSDVVVNVDVFDSHVAENTVGVEDAADDEAEAHQESHASENSTENVNENANENSHEDANENINANTNENVTEDTTEDTTEHTNENTDENAHEDTNENTEENANENTNENVEEKSEDQQSNPENEPAAEEPANETISDDTSAPATEETGNNDNSANNENSGNNETNTSNDNNATENPQ